MGAKTAEVEQALASVAANVHTELVGFRWRPRDLRLHVLGRFTLTLTAGLLATVELDRVSWQLRENWPVSVSVRLGVSYEPALNLLPLLTLPPALPLTRDPDIRTVSLDESGAISAVSDQIVAHIRDHAQSFARGFLTAADILAAMPADGSAQRLTLLAALERVDEVRAGLASYPTERVSDRRFVRQLRRWLDAGGPTPPPIEDTLALLPPQCPMPSWSGLRAKAALKAEADRAVKAQAKGKDRAEISNIIDREHADRGVAATPTSTAIRADLLFTRHQPFGLVRTYLGGMRMLVSMLADAVGLARSRPAELDWLRPPVRASFGVRDLSDRHAAVHIDPQARGWLARAFAESPRRIGPLVPVDVWLCRDDTETAGLSAHIGQKRVGVLTEAESVRFGPVLTAAAMFDEDPVLKGSLLNQRGSLMLEIGLPYDPGDTVVQATPDRGRLRRALRRSATSLLLAVILLAAGAATTQRRAGRSRPPSGARPMP